MNSPVKKVRFYPTFFKFFLCNLVLIFLLSGCIFFFSFKTLKGFYLRQLESDMKKVALSLSDIFLPYMEKMSAAPLNVQPEINRLAKKYGKRLKIRITVIAPDGTVWGDSERSPQTMENHANRPEIKGALKRQSASILRFSATLQRYMLYTAILISKDKKPLGYLRVSIFVKDINELLERLKKQLFELTITLSLIASLIALVFSKSFSNPLALVMKAVSDIAKGNFKTRINIQSQDEWGQLARHLNEMAQKLEDLFNELSLERKELKSIMERIQAGLLVLDLEGRIIFCNQSFKLFGGVQLPRGNDTLEGRFYWEVLRGADLNPFLQKIRQKPGNYLEEITIKSNIYLCSTTYMKRRKQLVLIFHDITPLKEIQRVKRDLVANVSHELKTPLTAIRGFVETLLDMEEEPDKRHYLEIIERHTKRLDNIIKDLLILSDLENKKELNLEKVNLPKLINEIQTLFISRIKKKGLLFVTEVAPGAEEIKADAFQLEQLFFNLIDNAIKYTPKGKIEVKVTPFGEDKIKIIVSDSGIGIPQEHLPYIFERFYVVNKSRSRKSGGTGLGLSIVKHIVQIHKGEIKVRSKLGKGTKFVVVLPKRL